VSEISYKYLSQADIAEDSRFPFTRARVKRLFNKRKENGLAVYVAKIGKLIYIREDDLIRWIESHREESAKEFLKSEGLFVDDIPQK